MPVASNGQADAATTQVAVSCLTDARGESVRASSTVVNNTQLRCLPYLFLCQFAENPEVGKFRFSEAIKDYCSGVP